MNFLGNRGSVPLLLSSPASFSACTEDSRKRVFKFVCSDEGAELEVCLEYPCDNVLGQAALTSDDGTEVSPAAVGFTAVGGGELGVEVDGLIEIGVSPLDAGIPRSNVGWGMMASWYGSNGNWGRSNRRPSSSLCTSFVSGVPTSARRLNVFGGVGASSGTTLSHTSAWSSSSAVGCPTDRF